MTHTHPQAKKRRNQKNRSVRPHRGFVKGHCHRRGHRRCRWLLRLMQPDRHTDDDMWVGEQESGKDTINTWVDSSFHRYVLFWFFLACCILHPPSLTCPSSLQKKGEASQGCDQRQLPLVNLSWMQDTRPRSQSEKKNGHRNKLKQTPNPETHC